MHARVVLGAMSHLERSVLSWGSSIIIEGYRDRTKTCNRALYSLDGVERLLHLYLDALRAELTRD